MSTVEQPPLTDEEKARIEKLAKLEMQATNGNVAAQKKMVEINSALVALQAKASRGDAKAKRILYTLRESGLVQLTIAPRKKNPQLAMAGSQIGFNGHLAFIRGVGEEEIALAREGGACERAALRRRLA